MEVSKARRYPITKTKSFPGNYENLARIADFVREIAQKAGFEKFSVYSIEMAVDEACSNIIEHAYEGEGKGKIRCTCSVGEKSFKVVLKDWGKTFDPSQISMPNLSHNLDEREAHGLGIYFIRQWMDEVHFATNGMENILVMVKNR